MDRHFIDLLRGAVGGLIARVIAALAVFLFGVLLARILGAAGSGLFYLALALVSVTAVLCRAGLDGTVVRFVASHLARGERESGGHIYARSVLLVGLLTLLAAAVLYQAAPSLALSVFSKPELAAVLQSMAIVLPPLALVMLHGQFLQAEKRVAAAVMVQTGLVPLLTALMLVLLPVAWSLSLTVRAYAISAFTTLAIGVFWNRRGSVYSPVLSRGYDFSPLIRSARVLAASDIINKIIQPWAPVIFLGLWSTTESIGLYSAANRLAALVVFATMPVNRMLAPKMAELWAHNDRAGFFRLSRQAALLMMAVSLPVAGALLAAPEALLALFGKEFTVARTLLWLLAFGQLLNALTGPVRSMLIMTGHEKDHRLSSAAGGLTIVLLSLLLIPGMQAEGAAVAAAAGMVMNNLVAAMQVWRRLGVVPLLGRGVKQV